VEKENVLDIITDTYIIYHHMIKEKRGDIYVNGVGMFLVILHVPIWQG
jgi:hypothetical protein